MKGIRVLEELLSVFCAFAPLGVLLYSESYESKIFSMVFYGMWLCVMKWLGFGLFCKKEEQVK